MSCSSTALPAIRALGRYSFVAADPFAWIEASAGDADPLAERRSSSGGSYPTPAHPDLPPFQGGVAGLFGYELGRTLETVSRGALRRLSTPALAVGAYDVVLAFDHEQDAAWIISQGFPETDADRPPRPRRRPPRPIPQSPHGLR